MRIGVLLFISTQVEYTYYIMHYINLTSTIKKKKL